MVLPKPFPKTNGIYNTNNPAFILFGSRFFFDQTILELLAEFLAIALSPKWIGDKGPITAPLPSLQELSNWSATNGVKLKYHTPIRLNLKLFALLCASPLDTRHQVHKEHYIYLAEEFANRIQSIGKESMEIKDWIEDFLMGFQGAGQERTWCAQTLYPIVSSFLLQETIWKKTFARNKQLDWRTVRYGLNNFFGTKQHLFWARGGELLYLQLCNLFARKSTNNMEKRLGYDGEKYSINILHQHLMKGFQLLKEKEPDAINHMVAFIEGLDPETHHSCKKLSGLECEWCPEESWPEAYAFAIEINRILRAILDPIERLELMQFGCALQVLRSMCAQSVRYSSIGFKDCFTKGGALGYAWLFSPKEKFSRQQRLASCQNLGMVFHLIQSALQNKNIIKQATSVKSKRAISDSKLDKNYGYKLFNSLGKRLGIIFPRGGAEPRFVLTDKLLRYLVLTLLDPGTSCTYTEFKRRIYSHHGIAIEDQELENAIVWSGLPPNSSLIPAGGSVLTEMLRAGGFLIELSDGCSIVRNPCSPQF